ncbi:uncharacterized protein LOC105218627 isoform X2 [Zeugodacus cucurbitae]|uniref:uncharacterized protein LOC105218627 isoform X2 n=1 Tax=Zeugodacus cucurbitae TaxID=28588 RepID=UPI0005968D60|nr:uncharacterized protein LOC105218627 isoform X2 [Zeugodacus cucurbitae]
MDAVNWLRLSLLLTLAFLKLSHGIQVTPAPKVANITKTLLQEELLLDTNNGTLVSDSVLSASERNRRLIPYMAFYLPPDFPINQQYAVQGPKGALPHNSKYTKPLAVEGPLPPPVNSGHISLPQEYMNLRAPPPGILGDNGDLAYAAPAPPQQHYLPSAGDVYHQLAYAAAGPAPQPTAMPQHSPPPLSQSLINTKSSKVPVLHLLPPGPPGPTVAPIIKHKHKTVQHFPPTKPPAVQQLPYEQPQPLRQKTNRHNAVHQQQQQQLQLQQQALPVFTSQHELQHQQQQQQQLPVYRQQTRPKQSKVNLTPFTPSNTLPGHFIPIIYTPVNGDDNNNNNNNHDGSNALHYGYDNPTVVLVDDLSPPLQPVNLPQQQQQHQQQQQQPAQFKPISPPHATADNEYTLVSSGVPFEAPRQQQQQQQLQQQYQQQKYITATGAPGDTLAPQQAELPRGPAVSSSPLIPHSTTSSTYHIINEPSAPVHPSLTSAPQKQTQYNNNNVKQQQTHSQRHLTRPRQKQTQFQLPRPASIFEPAQELLEQQQQQQPQQQHQQQDTYTYLNDETMTPQEKYVRYLQQRIRYNKQQQKQRERAKQRENFIQQHQQQQQYEVQQQPPHSQIVVLGNGDGAPPSAPAPPFATTSDTQQQLDANAQVNYPQHSPIGHAVYPHPELHVPPNHQPPSNVATLKQVVKIPVRTLVSEALDAFQQQQQQQQQQHQQQLALKGSSGGGVAYRQQQPQYASGLGPPATQYIDYIVDDPKQSLDDEQQQQQHNIVGTSVPQKPETQQNAFIVISTSTPPLIPPVDDINQDYYEPTRRPVYKQQPALRLQPLPPVNSKHNYATRRPFVPATAPEAQPPPPPPATPEEVIKPKFAYTEPKLNFGDVIKPATTAAKLRPSHKYAGGIGSKLAPLAPPTAPEVTPSTQQHQQEQQQVNLPEYYNPPVPVAAKTTPVLDPNQLPDIRSSSLAEILHKLQASNHLPRTLTPENIDNSIKTLVMILENLKQTQTIVPNPPQHHERPAVAPDYDYGTSSEDLNGAAPDLSSVLSPVVPNKHPGPSTGRAGIDYPNYADIPQTNFNCGEQRYKGFFGDPETNCQVWHYCDLNGGKASFLCPNGTIFSQIALTCDWWFNVKCSTTAQLYVLNERLYKYILPFTPKFPEDYSGPLVDKYLAMKFQEMEEKMRIEKEKVEKTALADVAATTGTETSNNIESDEVSDDGTNTNEHSVDDTDDTDDEDTEVTTVADLRTLPRAMDAHNKHGAVNAHVSEQSSERNLLIDDEVDDIAKRGSVDTFESSTIPTVSAATSANKLDDAPAFSLKPIVVSSTQGPDYEDDANDASAAQHNVRNADEAVSNRLTTEAAQTTTKAQENQIQVQASPKPVRQTSNIDVEKVEVIEIKAEGAAGQLGAKMYYGAESTKEMR